MSASVLVRSAFALAASARASRERGLRRDPRRALGEDHRMSIGKVGGKRFGGSGHRARESYPPPSASRNLHPTEVGRQVAWG